MPTNTKIAHAAAAVDHDEHEAAIQALDATIAAASAARAMLVARRAAGAGDPGEWLTLDAARLELGVKASKGPDPNRACKDRLRALGVDVAKVGHALLVRRSSLTAAIEAQARPLRPAAPRPGPASTTSPTEEDDAAALARAGLRLVGPRQAGGRR